MKASCSADLFDPQTTMDSDFSPRGKEGSGSSGDISFSFAFNNDLFSDLVLRIEIMSGLPENKCDGDGCSSILDWARNRKRRREEIKKENGPVSEDCCCTAWDGDAFFNKARRHG